MMRYAKSRYANLPSLTPQKRSRSGMGVAALALIAGVVATTALATSDRGEPEPDYNLPEPVLEQSETIIERAERLHLEQTGEALPAAPDEAPVPPRASSTPAKTTHAEAPLPEGDADEASSSVQIALAAPASKVLRIADEIKPNQAFSLALQGQGVSGREVAALVGALKSVQDLRRVRAGDAFVIEDESGAQNGVQVDKFTFRPRAAWPKYFRAERKVEGEKVSFEVHTEAPEITTQIASVSGEVASSIYNSMKKQGEGDGLVSRFVDVFAWNIDFYRETQKGDTYKVLVEKRFADDKFAGYGRVLAAEFVNAGRVHRGYNFKSSDGKVAGMFTDKGNSLERTFLKSPMEIVRITSRYGQRFHPVLKRWRSHNGVDYGAARGTPFWSVADGVVTEARYSKTAGNMIRIRHAQGYTTEYFHATKFGPGIKVGAKVKQRQVVGYVGTTGRSTGPHLHFGMKRKGKYVQPKKQKFPGADPINKKYKKEFEAFIAPLHADMEALGVS